jgi:hypothetical protein
VTSFKRKTKHVRVRKHENQPTPQCTSITLSSIEHRPTFGIKIFGLLLTICLGIVGLFVGIITATSCISLLEKILLVRYAPDWLVGGGVVWATLCMCAASPLLRHFCYYLKQVHLRSTGIMAEATVVGCEWSTSRGPEQIDLIVAWQDPITSQIYTYERHYTFFGELFSEKKCAMFKSYYAGAYLPLAFHPERPRYFALDIPFVPCWYDVLW